MAANNKPIKYLPKAGECIRYVESLGYTLTGHTRGMYLFTINDPSTRPIHNHEMTWTLGEMRHAVKFGC